MRHCGYAMYLVLSRHFAFTLSQTPSNLIIVVRLWILGSLTSSCGRRPLPTGGDEGNRTLDPLLAGQVLSQLSYTPIGISE